MRNVYLLSVWLHIVAAAAWIGGMIFLSLILVPVLRRPEHRGISSSLIHLIGVRFRVAGWIALGLLVVTGTFNLAYRGVRWEAVWSGQLWQTSFGRVLAVKVLLVVLVLLASVLHDFVVGPRARLLAQAHPNSGEAQRLRRQAAWIGRVNLLLALGVAALGIMLVRGTP